jgi:hypothetical protein
MKHIQTYESFKKTYGQNISVNDFRKIPVGKMILYMGTRYEVLANDGYVLNLKGEDGDMITVNLGQFNHGGQINESVNEARSIEKIEKDRTRVINDMAEIVTNWKAAKQSGDKQAEASFLQRLKDLTATRKGLEKELNQAIAGKDRNIKLVISEHDAIFEGTISEIDVLAKEAKNFKDFVKEFKKEYSDLTDLGDSKELEKWLKGVYDSAVNEGEIADQTIFDLWKETYGENFIKEYPKMTKVLQGRPKVDRKEFARIWDHIYGEDFKEEYPSMWDKMEETEVEISERNAFLGARAKAIEEDLEEFEFNGKIYPVLNKPK